MKVSSRDLSFIAVFAAIYAVLVYVFAPISFYALQFRVAGVLRPAIAKKWILAVGYTLGVVVGNLFSPYTGTYELLFMPIMSFVAGIMGYVLAQRFNKNYFIAGFVIATIISFSVSWMLNQMFGMSLWMTLPAILLAEHIVCFIGACVFKSIETRFKWW